MRPALPVSALALLALVLASLLPAAAAEPVPVRAEVYVLNVGNYDTAKGTYLADFYLTLSWNATAAGEDFSPLRFEFMNGRASAMDRTSDATREDGTRSVTWRVQANLYAEPRFDRYPYDTQRLAIEFEDVTHGLADLAYVADAAGSGLDEQARVAGWRVRSVAFDAVEKAYPGDEAFSRARFVVEVQREPLSSTIKSFLPPAAFMAVAALGFFFHPSKVLNRLTLGTGMLISAVAFHISQTSSLPPIGSLILFDKAMLGVYVFLAGCLAVATLISIDEDWWKDRDHTRAINRWGVAATVGATLLTWGLLLGL